MKQVADSLLAFQHMFPDDDARAAWLIEMRWPDGFVCPACGHEKGWALRVKSTHLRVRRLPPADLGDGRDDPARQQAAAHRLVLGRLPDGDPLQRHLCPAAPETARYRLLPQRLAARPQAARQHGRPRAQPVMFRAWWTLNRRGPCLPFRPKTDHSRAGAARTAATTASPLLIGCRRHRILVDGNIPGRLRAVPKSPPYGAVTTSDTIVETRRQSRRPRKPTAGPAYRSNGPPPIAHNVHVVGKTAAHLVLPWI